MYCLSFANFGHMNIDCGCNILPPFDHDYTIEKDSMITLSIENTGVIPIDISNNENVWFNKNT